MVFCIDPNLVKLARDHSGAYGSCYENNPTVGISRGTGETWANVSMPSIVAIRSVTEALTLVLDIADLFLTAAVSCLYPPMQVEWGTVPH